MILIYLFAIIVIILALYNFWRVWRFLFIPKKGPGYISPEYPKITSPIEPVESREIFDKLMSSDEKEVSSGSLAVINTRDKKILDELSSNLDNIILSTNKKIRKGTNLQVHTLDHAIEKLALYLRADECLCSMYTSKGYSQYDPEREEAKQHVTISSKELHESGWGHVWSCNCNECGSKYIVEYREYHFPWWQWTKL